MFPFRHLHILLLRLSKFHSRKGLYKFLASHFAQTPTEAIVLSVGAGGEVNALLRKYLTNVVELDIDPQRHPDILGDICTAKLEDDWFDLVVMSEVLEHVQSPQLAIDNIRRALAPGGKLLLSTPFMIPIHEAPHDYYRYTRFGLAFLLRGFENVVIQERNSYFEAIGVLWLRLLQSETHSGRLLSFLVAPLVLVGWPITMLLSAVVKTHTATSGYVAVAFKPR